MVSNKAEEDDEEKRETWGNKVEFILATLGYSVGMGALTRFPYLVMKNGGGAFLIPFILCMVFAGWPLFYMELILGQFSGRSPLTLWESISPAFKGLGLSVTALSGIVSLYYLPLTWSLFYLVASCQPVIPWASCGNPWNTERCYDPAANLSNITNSTTSNFTDITTIRVSAAEEFWNEYILGISSGIDEVGSLRWQLVVSHLVCWFGVFLCTMRGAASAGKVVYVTATLPYVLITILLIYGCTLEGSADGLIFFLLPQWDKLLDYNIWLEAAIQVIFQLGPAWGGLITMASYNSFNSKCYRDSLLITGLNFFTALYGGFAIFSILGFMAHRYGVPVSEVAQSGPGLAFVAYPEAIAQMPVPQLWAVIFFLTLITIGIDSQFGMFDTLVSGVMDVFPSLRKWKVLVTAVFASCCFLLGLPFCTEAGMYIYQILDWYASALTFSMVGLVEAIVICYIYGQKRFASDAALMFGSEPNYVVRGAWMVSTPLVLGTMLFVGVWNLTPPVYTYTNYVYPEWAIAIGWCVALVSFLPTPIMLIYVLIRTPGSCLERLHSSFKPTEKWLPNMPELVAAYKQRWYSGKGANRTAEETLDDRPPAYNEIAPVDAVKPHDLYLASIGYFESTEL